MAFAYKNFASIQADLQSNGIFQRGWAEPRGGPTLDGAGMLAQLTAVQDATLLVYDVYGAQFRQATAAAAGSLAYVRTALQMAGPLASDANWDLVFSIGFETVDADLRFAAGVFLSGENIEDVWNGNDPAHTYCLIQKQSGAATAYLSVREAGGGLVTQTPFVTWVPATGLNYWILLRKRGTTFHCYIYNPTTYDYIDYQTVAGRTLTAGTSLSVCAGVNSTAGVARHLRHFGWYCQQMPGTVALF